MLSTHGQEMPAASGMESTWEVRETLRYPWTSWPGVEPTDNSLGVLHMDNHTGVLKTYGACSSHSLKVSIQGCADWETLKGQSYLRNLGKGNLILAGGDVSWNWGQD